MKQEPAAIIGLVEAVLISALMLVAYLADWTADTTTLVAAVVGSAVALIGAVVTRSKVSPVAN